MSGPNTFRSLAGMSDRAVEAERLLGVRTTELQDERAVSAHLEKRLREVESELVSAREHLGKIAGEVAQWVEEGFVEFREDPLPDGLPLPDSDESLELVLAWFDELKEESK